MLTLIIACSCKVELPEIFTENQAARIIVNSMEDRHLSRSWQGIPTIENFDDKVWISWYSGTEGEGAGNFVTVWHSYNETLSWNKDYIIIDPKEEYRCFDPILWKHNEKLYLFYNQSKGWWDGIGGIWYVVIEKNPSKDFIISAPKRIGNGVLANKPTLIQDKINLPISVWKNPKTQPEISGVFNYILNQDLTLINQQKIPIEDSVRSYDEPSFVVLNNRFEVFIRTKNGIYNSYFDGANWSKATKYSSLIPNIDARFHISNSKNGKAIMVYNDSDRLRNNLTYAEYNSLSKDWDNFITIDARDTVSYPDMMEYQNSFYVIYDRNRYSDKEINMAIINKHDSKIIQVD